MNTWRVPPFPGMHRTGPAVLVLDWIAAVRVERVYHASAFLLVQVLPVMSTEWISIAECSTPGTECHDEDEYRRRSDIARASADNAVAVVEAALAGVSR